jgi:hypothetical protein
MGSRRVVWLAIALISACAAPHRVVRVTAHDAAERAKFGNDVVFYALPRTIIGTNAQVVRRTLTPGRCGDQTALAKQLDLDEKALLRSSEKSVFRYELMSITLTPRSEPDPDQIFAVEIGPKFLQRRSQLLELSDRGLISANMSEAASQGTEVAVGVLELGASIAGKVFFAGESVEFCKEVVARAVRLKKELQDLERGAIDDRPYLYQSKDVLELILAKIREQRAADLAEFTGIPGPTLAGTVQCDWIPPQRFEGRDGARPEFHEVDDRVLFRLSSTRGVLEAGAFCRVPVGFDKPSSGNETIKTVQLRTKASDAALPDRVRKAQELADGDSMGLFYRVPGVARASVSVDEEVRAETETLVAQYGTVAALPGGTIWASSAKYDTKLFEPSGGMRRLDTSGTSVDTAALGKISPAISPLVEKATKAGPDEELNEVTRQRQLLEERKKMECYRKNGWEGCN